MINYESSRVRMQEIRDNAIRADSLDFSQTSQLSCRLRFSPATDTPRNPFISRQCSPDAAETIRYTWNQLARSAGKWVKGLTAQKRSGEKEREREKKNARSRCSLRNDSTVAGSIFLSLRFFVMHLFLSLFPLSLFVFLLHSISPPLFLFLHFSILLSSGSLCLSARLWDVCLSLFHPLHD